MTWMQSAWAVQVHSSLSLNRKAGWCIPGEPTDLCLGLASGRHMFGALSLKGVSTAAVLKGFLYKTLLVWATDSWHLLRKQSWHHSGGRAKWKQTINIHSQLVVISTIPWRNPLLSTNSISLCAFPTPAPTPQFILYSLRAFIDHNNEFPERWTLSRGSIYLTERSESL